MTGHRDAPLRHVLRMASPGPIVRAVLASAAADLAGLGLMATAAWLIARASQRPGLAALGAGIVAVRACALSQGFFRYGERHTGHDAALRAIADLRVHVFRRLATRGAPGSHGGAGLRGEDLLSRMVSDVEAVQDLVARWAVPAAAAILTSAVATVLAVALLPAAGAALGAGLLLAWALAWALTATGAPRTGTPQTSAARTGGLADRAGVARAQADLAARVTDVVNGADDLVVCGGADAALGAADAAGTALAGAERRVAARAASGSALAIGMQWATALVVTWLALAATAGTRLEPVFVAVLALVALSAFEPVGQVVAAATRVPELRRCATRLVAVLDADPAVREPDRPLPPPAKPADIRLAGLRVTYPDNRVPALAGVDLWLPQGHRLAVVGASGSGKSTLLAVLMRFIEPSGGDAWLAGARLRDYAGEDVRAVVTGLTQQAHVFHASVRANLALARPDADVDALRAAAGRARLLDWIESLPQGWDTVVGDDGRRLSGGERARLALARALLADPAVLLLDEATEGLDPVMADEIVADLLGEPGDRTVVLVTHRLCGLNAADEVVVLDGGRVVQRGTHARLAAVPGPYRDRLAAQRLADQAMPGPVTGS